MITQYPVYLTLTDEDIVTYMLHPSYKGVNLTAKQLDTANEWITTKDPSFITSLINCQAQAMLFPSTFFTKCCYQDFTD